MEKWKIDKYKEYLTRKEEILKQLENTLPKLNNNYIRSQHIKEIDKTKATINALKEII
jgi:hypothetical protein